MQNCHNCGSPIPTGPLPATHCQKCGATLAGHAPGAPPPFFGGPDASLQAPVVTMPDDTNTAMQQFPGDPIDDHGPPSIGLDDDFSPPSKPASPFAPPPPPTGPPRTPAPKGPPSMGATRRAGTPPPPPAPTLSPADSMPGVAEFDLSGLESPSLEDDNLSPHELDLPAPVSPDGGLDLPGPVSIPPTQPSHNPFAAPPIDPSDLPTPVELDLPTPIQSHAPPAPHSPAPVSAPPGLDLPTPVDLDLPTPVEHSNLPQPAGMDVRPAGMDVRPAGMEVQPAGMDMRPAAMDLEPAFTGLEPAAMDLESATTGLQPAEMALTPADLDLEPADGLRPADLGLAPADQGLAPAAARGAQGGYGPGASAAAAAASVGTAGALPAPTRTPSPAVKAERAPRRGTLILAGGLLAVGLAGAGVLYSGILDDVEDPQPQALNGGKAGTDTKAPPAEVASERNADVLALLAADTPASYATAVTTAEAAGDAAGAAEAALLLHFRYGPDPDMAVKAAKMIERYKSQTDPFVQRVLGLAALAGGQLDSAEAALAGEDVRTRLYRGWLRLEQGKPTEAATEAQAVLVANANDVAAQALQLAATSRTNPTQALTDAEAALEGKESHPGLAEQLIQIGLETGWLAKSKDALAKLDAADTDPKGYQARLARIRGDVDNASGHYASAAKHYAASLELIEADMKTSIARARALVAARNFSDAQVVVNGLIRTQPNAPETHLLAAEVAIAGGETDNALESLAKVQKALPTDPRVPYMAGQIHALKLEVEDAQKMFATARERDAKFYKATVDEATLLAKVKQLESATELLGKETTAAEKDGRKKDAATLLVTKAMLLAATGNRTAAIAELTKALSLVPTHNEAQLQRGKLRLQTGELAEGEADLEAVFERTAGYPGLAAALGRIYLRDNRIEELEGLLGPELDGENTPRELVTLGGRLRLTQGKLAEAKKLIEIALANNPSDWEAHMLMSEVHLQSGDHKAALIEIEKARPVNPEAELFLQKGRVLEFNQEYEEARKLYYQAIDTDRDQHEARFLYGRAQYHENLLGGALENLQYLSTVKSIEKAPWYPEVWMYLGRTQGDLSKDEEAILSLRKATELNEEYAEAHCHLGARYLIGTKSGKAIAELDKCIELAEKQGVDPAPEWYLDGLRDLGRAQLKAGKDAAAKKTLKKCLDLSSPTYPARGEVQRLLAQ